MRVAQFDQQTMRTYIRYRTLIWALILILTALTIGTYFHAKYDSFTISIDPATGHTQKSPDDLYAKPGNNI